MDIAQEFLFWIGSAISSLAALLLVWLWFAFQRSRASAAPAHHETSICKRIAPKYAATDIEYRLDGGRLRVDLLTKTHAIEVDWSYKYAEGIGQALLYGMKTGKRPGLILLCKRKQTDPYHIDCAELVCKRLGITLWTEWI